MMGSFSFIFAAPTVTSETPSASFSVEPAPAPSSENSRQSGNRKAGTNSREGTFCTSIPPSVERINIGFRRDELDPTILGKPPAPAAIAAVSVHKYWTSAFGKATDNTELMELLKLVEMYVYLSESRA
ncbi:hypothetical protein Fot_19779 [Forsythia ovata]|uniref:Uncharacterized protein n=1 Tax=Forsythia ovata TaxID=205694 RepID=A0ABD1VNQ0_9LAMI